MKKLILTLAVLLLAIPAFAGKHHVTINNTNNTYIDDTVKNSYEAGVDAPYLVKLSEKWFLGAEGGKDFNHTSANEGWYAIGKITFIGTLKDLSKQTETAK